MLTRLVLSLCLLICFSVPSVVHARYAPNPGKCFLCGVRAHQKRPYNGPLICVNFKQLQPGKVMVKFYRQGQQVFEVSNISGTEGSFCLGPQRFKGPDLIVFCNHDKSADLHQDDIQYLLDHRGTRRGEFACLLGTGPCNGIALVNKH